MSMWPFLLLFTSTSLAQQGPVTLRIATYSTRGIRTDDLKSPDTPRLKQLADIIQHLRPNIILLNEIATDNPENAQLFADRYLALPQSPDIEPLHFTAFTTPTNSGQPSALDLDKNGQVVTTYPSPDYSNDCWGPGDFPGHRGLALLIDSRLTFLAKDARTFRLLPWTYMPGNALPEDKSDTTQEKLRLSSTSHWDAPVRLPNGATLHLLCSNPIPFIADSTRLAARRNHDEISFWADYIDGAPYIVDDANHPGGLAEDAPFILLGDLNAAPKQTSAFKDPITTLFSCRRLNSQVIPQSDIDLPGLSPSDTTIAKLRVDYVLPSKDIAIVAAGVWRHPSTSGTTPSDHFPVWMDLRIAPPNPDR
jgi:endonuclease/exonuclease/phosphatase family metal-dependent hydrolase